MRLRIQTYAPLPDLKAWFLPTLNDGQDTILDLKDNLCSRVQVLKDGHYRAKDLLLSLEGFELLNDSPIGAVRDGDLLCVKLSPTSVIDDRDFSVVPSAWPSRINLLFLLQLHVLQEYLTKRKGKGLKVHQNLLR